MDVRVELWAFAKGKVRVVEVPDHEIKKNKGEKEILESVFRWGQNDFQPQPMPSVSVGDVIGLPSGKRYQVEAVGFRELKEGEKPGPAYPFLKEKKK